MKRICLNTVKALLVTVLLLVSNASYTQAQNTERPKSNRFGLGLRLSHLYDLDYKGFEKSKDDKTIEEDLSGLNGSKTKFDMAFGLDFIYFVSPLVSLDASFDMGTMTGQNSSQYYESNVQFYTLGFNYDLKGRNRNKVYRLVPFVRASFAFASFEAKRRFLLDGGLNTEVKDVTSQIGLGAGMRYHLSNNWHLNLQSEIISINSGSWSGYQLGTGSDYMVKSTFGIRYTFGKNETHQDRAIAWNFQNNVPSGNGTGAALIFFNDSLKSINNKIAVLQNDNQAINNKLVKDSDGDGVPDIKDQCPDEKGTLANGCNKIEAKELDPTITTTTTTTTTVVTPTTDPKAVENTTPKNGNGNKNSVKGGVNNGNQNATIIGSEIPQSFNGPLKNKLFIELSIVRFKLGSVEIDENSQQILVRVADILRNNTNIKVAVLGYADKIGSEDFNLNLSENRAQAVAKFLVEQGVNGANLRIKGLGKTSLIDIRDSDPANANNRRVEFVVE